jgi:hypothetical protein
MTGAGYPSMSSSAQADDPVIDASIQLFERQRILDAPLSRSMTAAGYPSVSSSAQADDPVIADASVPFAEPDKGSRAGELTLWPDLIRPSAPDG